MKKPHKNERDVLLSKSKEGKRTFLCGNKMSHRLPSFDVNPNPHFESEDKALEYLAETLVEIFFSIKRNEYQYKREYKEGSNLL
jgi:hypothetical protein